MGGKSRKMGTTSRILIDRIKAKIPTGKKTTTSKKEKKDGLLSIDIGFKWQ
jgi:hypothetical protein